MSPMSLHRQYDYQSIRCILEMAEASDDRADKLEHTFERERCDYEAEIAEVKANTTSTTSALGSLRQVLGQLMPILLTRSRSTSEFCNDGRLLHRPEKRKNTYRYRPTSGVLEGTPVTIHKCGGYSGPTSLGLSRKAKSSKTSPLHAIAHLKTPRILLATGAS